MNIVCGVVGRDRREPSKVEVLYFKVVVVQNGIFELLDLTKECLMKDVFCLVRTTFGSTIGLGCVNVGQASKT